MPLFCFVATVDFKCNIMRWLVKGTWNIWPETHHFFTMLFPHITGQHFPIPGFKIISQIALENSPPKCQQEISKIECWDMLSGMGFPTRLKREKVEISKEKTSQMIVKEKALREGCCERKKARTSVSSREKKDTNRNLARATTKSKSRMQTVSNGHVSRVERN